MADYKYLVYAGVAVGVGVGIYEGVTYLLPNSSCASNSSPCGQALQIINQQINNCMSAYTASFDAALKQYGSTGIPAPVLSNLNNLFNNCNALVKDAQQTASTFQSQTFEGALAKQIPLVVDAVLGIAALAFLPKIVAGVRTAGSAMSSLYNVAVRNRIQDGTITPGGAGTFSTNVSNSETQAVSYTTDDFEEYVSLGVLDSVEADAAIASETTALDEDAVATIDALASILSVGGRKATQSLRSMYRR